MKKKIFALLSVLLIVTLLWGCSPATPSESSGSSGKSEASQSTSESETEPEPREVITLEVTVGSGFAGLATGSWWSKIIEEELGIRINGVNHTEDVMTTYIAAKDLPDIVRMDRPAEQQLAYTAGLLVNLDDYTDQMPSILENYPAGSLQFQRDKFEDGGLYLIPCGANTYPTSYGSCEYAMRLDFPYYQEYVEANGEPELTDIEDFLPVLKWIQDQHPTNGEGMPAYAMSIFAEWDNEYMNYATWFAEQTGVKYSGYTEINHDTMEWIPIFDKDSQYYRMAKLLFDANQMGILDPDCLTQTWTDYTAKVADRRIYSTYCFSSNEYIKLIPYENWHTVDYTGPLHLGNGSGQWGMGISTTGEYIERCVEFLNYCINEDNWWTLQFGPQGEYWDINSDGQVYKTEFGIAMDSDPESKLSDGGRIGDIGTIASWNFRFINQNSVINKTYGVGYNTASWPTADTSTKTDTAVAWEAWAGEKYNVSVDGFLSEIQLANAIDAFATYRGSASAAVTPDDIQEKFDRIKAVFPSTVWQMIYASSEAEFEQLWDNLTQQCYDMGAEEVMEYFANTYIEGVQTFESYIY